MAGQRRRVYRAPDRFAGLLERIAEREKLGLAVGGSEERNAHGKIVGGEARRDDEVGEAGERRRDRGRDTAAAVVSLCA